MIWGCGGPACLKGHAGTFPLLYGHIAFGWRLTPIISIVGRNPNAGHMTIDESGTIWRCYLFFLDDWDDRYRYVSSLAGNLGSRCRGQQFPFNKVHGCAILVCLSKRSSAGGGPGTC